MSACGPAVSDAAKAKADEAKKKFADGTLLIYSGPLEDNAGKEVIPAGDDGPSATIKPEAMGYPVDGEVDAGS